MERTAVNPWPWSVGQGFNQAELLTNPTKMLVCSGQTSTGDDGNVQHAGDMAGQMALAAANLRKVVAAAGMSADDIVRITAYTTDVDEFVANIAAMGGGAPAAFTLIGVSRLAYPELLVELEAIAVA